MLTFTPSNKIIGKMPDDEAAKTPVLVAVSAAPSKPETVKVVVNVVFQSVPLKRPLGRGLWYVGSTGARIELGALKGKITDHTRGRKIDVDYKVKRGKEQTISAKIAPSAKVGEETEISLGEIGAEHKGSREAESEYTSTENILAVAERGDTAVVWDHRMARGERIVRDFLFGNLKLWAECKWDGEPKQGQVKLQTSTFFFDDESRRVSARAALMMEFILSCRSSKIVSDWSWPPSGISKNPPKCRSWVLR